MRYVETTENGPTNREGVTRIEIKNKWLRSWNLAYLRKTKGILRIVTGVFALAGFIAEVSTPYCYYGYNCVNLAYVSTYRYFATITLSTFILSIIMVFFNINGHVRETLLKNRVLYYIELSVLAVISFLNLFAIVFLIGQSGGKISYQAAAVLATISLTAAEAHLILIAIRFKMFSKLKRKKVKTDSSDNVLPTQRVSISEPVLLNGQEGQIKFNSIYANCEEPITNDLKSGGHYPSSDSFEDSDDDNYPQQITLSINRD